MALLDLLQQQVLLKNCERPQQQMLQTPKAYQGCTSQPAAS